MPGLPTRLVQELNVGTVSRIYYTFYDCKSFFHLIVGGFQQACITNKCIHYFTHPFQDACPPKATTRDDMAFQ